MPRNVRNFWITLQVDGKTTRVETGPRAADGGFELTLLMRDEGSIVRAFDIVGRNINGTLSARVEARDVMPVLDADAGYLEFETKR